MKMKNVKSILRNCIHDLNECKEYFTARPLKDFSRTGKLPFNKIIESILCMGAGSLRNEMLDYFGFREDIATTSAFVRSTKGATTLSCCALPMDMALLIWLLKSLLQSGYALPAASSEWTP